MQSPIEEESEEELEEGVEDEEQMEEEEGEDWKSSADGRAKSRLSVFDSGHASLLSDEDRPDSVFRAKRVSVGSLLACVCGITKRLLVLMARKGRVSGGPSTCTKAVDTAKGKNENAG